MSANGDLETRETADELAALARVLHETQERIVRLTRAEVDAIANPSGTPYLLPEAQGRLRRSEADQRTYAKKLSAIIDALPAHVALLDADGTVVNVNESWKRFAQENGGDPDAQLGLNYLAVAEATCGDDAVCANQVAGGVRAVLFNDASSFSVDYPCHSPTNRRWFRVVVAPLDATAREGAVVIHFDISDRKLAEETLRKSEQQYRYLFENNPHPMWVYDPETLRFLAVNGAAVERYGYSPSAFLNLAISDVQLDGQGLRAGIWRHRLKDGRTILADVSSTAIEFGGRPARLALALDVTAEVEAEGALRASETRLRAIFESASVSIAIFSRDGLVLDANSTTVEALEARDPGDVLGSALSFVHPGDRDAFGDALRRAADGEPGHLDLRVVALSGRERWMAAYLSSIHDASGKVDNVLYVARDVSDERRTAAALAALQRQTDLILTSIGEGILGVDGQGRVLFVNPAYSAMVGHEIGAMLGENAHALVHHHRVDGSVYDSGDCPIGKTLLDGMTRVVDDEVFFRADGTSFPVEYVCAPIIDDRGTIVGAVVSTSDISARKATEEALRRSDSEQRALVAEIKAERARLVTAQAVAKIGSWEVDLRTLDSIYSDEMYRILEVDRAVPASHFGVLAVTHPDDRAMVDEAFRASFYTREASTLAHRLLLPDGRVKHVVALWRTFADEEGHPVRAVGVCQDVTDQRTSADELERSRKLLDMASHLSRLGAWAVDVNDLNAIFWSDEVRAIFEVSADFDPVWNTHSERYAPDHGDTVRRDVEVCARTGNPIDREVQIITARGRKRWVRIVAEAVRDQLGAIVGVQGAIQDIDHQRRLSEQLAESEERFRYVAQATSDAIWDWDLTTGHVWWNSGIETLFGYGADEIGDGLASWSERIHPDDRAGTLASMEAHLADGNAAWQHQYRFCRRDGEYAQVIERGTVIRDASGRAVRKIGSLSDVTQRLALEEHVRQSQRLESLGQLTGGVAHDFNNLLTVIVGNAELLVDQLPSSERSHQMASMIGKAAQRGADLTQRLLAFARRQTLEPTPIDVNELVAGMVGMLKRTIDEDVELEVSCQSDLWTAFSDIGQLEDALLNLCLNARDAMPNGGRLVIETSNARIDREYTKRYDELAAGDYVLLSISDNGLGIAPENLARVFDPFFTTKVKGTGLGLSMVYGFMKQSGGHISLYSEPGFGTTVKLYVPRIAAGADAHLLKEAQEGPPAAGTERILLVEDDEMVRGYAQEQLGAFGYRVIAAASGTDALNILRQGAPFDLLFTDIVMPGGMNGIKLAEEARRLRPGLKVLYTSGYAAGVVKHGKLDSGALLVSKPYHRAELARKIRLALDSQDGDEL